MSNTDDSFTTIVGGPASATAAATVTTSTFVPPTSTSATKANSSSETSSPTDDALEDNPFISWGHCYFDNSGDEAPSRFIPCGNVNFGHVSCCESQDMCLSSNACYNAQFGVTYLAGCTDNEYKEGVCPGKGSYYDDAWLGLVYCNSTSNEWVGCEANRGINTVTTARPCWCPTTSRTVAFTDAATLANMAKLGTATGQSIDWKGGFLPTTSKPATTTSIDDLTSGSSSRPASSITSTSPTATSVPSDAQSDTDGTHRKLAIGLGVGLGFATVLCIVLILLRRYRNKKNGEQPEEKASEHPQPVTLYPNDPSEELQSPAWSGHKSELDAIGTASPSPRYGDFSSTKSEIEGSPGMGGEGRPVKDGGYEMPGKLGTVYELPG